MSYKSVGVHRCSLRKNSDSGLSKLSPRSNALSKLWRHLRKYFLPSYAHYETKYHFKSNVSLKMEKIRMAKNFPSYVIHPFSILNICRETMMLLVWFDRYFINIYMMCFLFTNNKEMGLFISIISIACDLGYFVHICMMFITGFTLDKHIYLEPRNIAGKYIFSYFIIDFIDFFPTKSICKLINPNMMELQDAKLALIHFVSLLRLKTFCQYFRHTLYLLKVPKKMHRLLIFVELIFMMVHWFACLIYGVPKFLYSQYDTDKIPHSYMAKVQFMKRNTLEKYIFCIHKVMCHFYKSGRGIYGTILIEEAIIYTFVLVIANAFHIYITIYILEWFKMMCNPENKFAIKLAQLNDYLTMKNCNVHLKYRIMLHYHHKFQSKYFQEEKILNGLSEHLQHELFLHNCVHIISHVNMFKGLPKHIVGHVIAVLQPEIYLPNDMIYKNGDVADCMYFISYGLTASYTAAGNEIMHSEDGDLIGCIGFNMGVHNQTAVAIDLTETFKWHKKDILASTSLYPELMSRILKIAEEVQQKSDNVDYNPDRDENYLKLVGKRRVVEDLIKRPT
ncbi:PREDICTED: potassium/sodium hyperpolarization-activated cyclic nucleotide-gated channel 1-like [Nicrophorus vespilloides]|uniref:Potassium/sodium hyperpolarization-activated cyclic nucleotide-gated channel 1-like n=1 Tax=Nicrophorus vespilloides TaxID=110193 RepID=A0ABM1MQ20_NICVS|nr:PREDICTED: potassium/sodium hyperpolarization-activated cyclic nucleotide-gated channel 1-like [Nicrophorus vespilloides]